MSATAEANLAVLEERDSVLAGRLRSCVVSGARLSDIDGSRVLEAKGPRGWVRLHSQHDPYAEAERLVDSANVSSSRLLTLLGFGGGFVLEAALKLLPEDAEVMLVEPNPALFRSALDLRDLRSLFSDRRVRYFVGEDLRVLPSRLERCLSDLAFRNPKVLEHPMISVLEPDYIQGVRQTLCDLMELEKTLVATRWAGQKSFHSNLLTNLSRMAAAPGAVELFNLFQGRPAILVSAGPSLNKQLPKLKEVQGRAVILCVDTAMRTLLNAGIVPDAVAAIDFTEVNLKHFAGVDTSRLSIVAAPTVYPACLRDHTGPLFFLRSDTPVMDWLLPFVGEKGQVTVGDSTAHTAFHLAERMGCGPIILIGQDLAFTGGKTHADGVATRRDTQQAPPEIWVESQDGGKVQTSATLMTILKHFEAKIADTKRQVINATEGGALIRGTLAMPFAEAVRKYCEDPFPAGDLIRKASRSPVGTDIRGIRSEIRTLRSRLARTRKLSHEGIYRTREILESFCNHDEDSVHHGVQRLEVLYKSVFRDRGLIRLLQGSLDVSLGRLRWANPPSGSSARHDFVEELLKDQLFLADLCYAARTFAAELKRTMKDWPQRQAPVSRLTEDWLRLSASAAPPGGRR